METLEEQPTRRSTRSALAEIPTHLSMFSIVDPDGRRTLNNNFQNTLFHEVERNVPASFLSPSPSPDEMIIRQRGRRRIPVTFSPDIDELKRTRTNVPKEGTPVKQPSSPGPSSSIVLRSTPRKRLLLLDPTETPEQTHQAPTKSSPKKIKLDRPLDASISEISDSLKACTSNQLITVIQKLLSKRPELEQDLKDIIPKPDLRPLEVHLMYLKRNISKAIPINRLCSKTDAIAYHRAAAHLVNFKKTVTDHGRRFVESKQWDVVMDYVIMAWKLVHLIPVFDNPSHNLPRRQCFKFLASQCLSALKYGNFSSEQLSFFQTKMKNFVTDSDEIKPVLSQLESKLLGICDSTCETV